MASLAHAANLLSDASRPAPDRRRFRRTPLTLTGRILSAGREYDCRTIDVSPGGACVVAPSKHDLGASAVIYLSELGRLPATVTRLGEDGVGVTFQATAHKREKIAEQLTWLLNKGRLRLDEERRSPRITGGGGVAIVLEDGKSVYCDVLDFSLVGASLRTAQKRPEIGAWVRVGQSYGRVSRYIEDGFAVDFQSPYPARK